MRGNREPRDIAFLQRVRTRETSFVYNARTAAAATNPPTIMPLPTTEPTTAALWVGVAEAAAAEVLAVAAAPVAAAPLAEVG